jgi:hypothetical protein
MYQADWCQPRGLMQVVEREKCGNRCSSEERRSLEEEILTGAIGRHSKV